MAIRAIIYLCLIAVLLFESSCRKEQHPGWDCPESFTISPLNLYINPYSPWTGSSIASCLPLNPLSKVSIVYRVDNYYTSLAELSNPYVLITWELPDWLEIIESKNNNSELLLIAGKEGTGEVVMHVIDGCTGHKQSIKVDVSILSQNVLYDAPDNIKPPYPLAFSGLTELDSIVYAATGRPNSFGNDKSLLQYNPSNGKWKTIGTNPSGKRFIRPYLTNWNNRLYLFTPEETWEIDPTTNTWNALAPFPGTHRIEMEAQHVSNKVYAGLGDLDGYFAHQDWWEFDLITGQWTQLPDCPGNLKLRPAIFEVNNDIMVAGSGLVCPYAYLNNDKTVYTYRTSSNIWELAPFELPAYPIVAFKVGGINYIMTHLRFYWFDEVNKQFIGSATSLDCNGRWHMEYGMGTVPYGFSAVTLGDEAIVLGSVDCMYGASKNSMRFFKP